MLFHDYVLRVLSHVLATSHRVMMKTKWGQEVLQQGQMLMDSVDSEQRSHRGSKVSVVEGRSVLLCCLVLDVTSVSTYEPVSCVSLMCLF